MAADAIAFAFLKERKMKITVAAIQTGPKLSTVQTTDGQKLGAWSDKLGQLGLTDGATFEVETQPWKDKTLIIKAMPVADATASAPANGNGGKVYADPEQMWVRETLTALIKAGEVKNDKRQLWDATNMLRALWRHTFGPSGALADNTALSRPTASQRALVERDARRITPASEAFFASQAGRIDELPEHSAA
jgi:hypothetical protein